MTTLSAPKVAIKIHPVPKMMLYAGVAGEMLTNTGMTDAAQINGLQQAIGDGLVSSLVVVGTHSDGKREIFRMAVKPFANTDTVAMQFDPAKSYAENLDVGVAALIQYAADLIKRRALKPEFFVVFSDRAKAMPGATAQALKRLNFQEWKEPPAPVEPPSWMAEFEPMARPAPPMPSSPVRYQQSVNTFVAPPPPPPAYRYVPVLTVTPAKDPGVTFTYETTRQK